MKTSISILTTLCIWFVLSFNGFAQRDIDQRTEIDFSFGNKIQMTNLFSGNYEDFFKNENYLLFNSSINIPLMKGWRIWGDLSYAKNNRKANRSYLLDAAAIAGGYNTEKFYMKILYSDFDSDIFDIGTGIAYRINFNRWSVEPRLGVGVYLFYSDDFAFTAKEKGSYQIYENRIMFDKSLSYTPYANVGANVNYYFSKNRFFVGVGINYQQTLMRLELEHRKKTWWENENYTEEIETRKGKLSSTLNMMVRVGLVFR